jgi:tetratricopeptide (TPR) repeat protein
MGAWGPGIFENDPAADFIAMVEDKSFQAVRNCLAKVNDAREDEYLEVDECSQALAAVAVVAAARGGLVPDFPDELKDRLDSFRRKCKPEDVENALRAAERIRARSELKELWEEAGGTEWQAAVDDLIGKLTGPATALPKEKKKKMQFRAGDIILIPISIDRYVVAKVFLASHVYKHCIFIGVTNTITDSLVVPASEPSEYIAQFFTTDQPLYEGIWHKVGELPLRDRERQATLRIDGLVGGSVWLGDERLRTATKQDRAKIPVMSVTGDLAVEYDIQVALGRLKARSVQERARVCHLRGLLYLQRNEPKKALEYLNQALSDDSQLAIAYWDRAKAWEALSRRDRAEQDREKALSIDPSLKR